MGINIITYSGKTRTAKHDAIVYDAALDRSGILNGCNVTANNNVITVSVGYGIIKGRVFEVTSENFTLSLPGSGTQYGALIATLDLGNTIPLTLETISSGTATFNLSEDENVNFNNGRYQMVIASYTLTPTAVTNIRKGHCIPADGMGSTDFNDYVKNGGYYFNSLTDYTNIPPGVESGWLDVYEARYPNGKGDSVKQIFYRLGNADTNHEVYIRTRNGNTWRVWRRIVTDADLTNGLDISPKFGSSTAESRMIGLQTSLRHVGLNISSGNNVGIYDITNNNWVMYSNKDGDVYIPHKLITSEFNPQRAVTVGDSTSTLPQDFTVLNKYRKASFTASANEVVGVYDNGAGAWLLEFRKDKSTIIHGTTYFDQPIRAAKSIVRGTTTITPTKVNTAAYRDVTWPQMGGVPTVVVTASTSVPQAVHVGTMNVTNTGCRIYLTRTDTAGLTGIQYIAIYTK